ncbi:MAG: hypothetical protein PUP90_32230 [Nostoc sp. S4]|nr:hypothetical protein [Nostoc sp. S4]
MCITNPEAIAFFRVDANYYLDFKLVEPSGDFGINNPHVCRTRQKTKPRTFTPISTW